MLGCLGSFLNVLWPSGSVLEPLLGGALGSCSLVSGRVRSCAVVCGRVRFGSGDVAWAAGGIMGGEQ